MVSQGLVKEFLAISALYLASILEGYNLGFSAAAIIDISNEMNNENSTSFITKISATTEQLSWFASSLTLGQVVGALVGGYLGGKYGPKMTIQIHGLICSVGWLVIGLAPNLALLIVGRVIVGFGHSLDVSNNTLLVAQYSTAKRRGIYLSLVGTVMGVGILFSYCMGAALYWRYASFIPPVLYMFLTFFLYFLPESPIWLLGHKSEQETKKALVFLRNSQDVSDELNDLKAIQEKENHGLTTIEAIKNLSLPHVRRPFLIIILNFVLVAFSGPVAIVFYAVGIFKDAGVDANEHLSAIITGIVLSAGGIFGLLLVEKLSRRAHSIITTSIMAASMIVLGVVMYLKTHGGESPALNILPIFCVTLYMFCNGAGPGLLIWVFVGELLPPEYKVLSGINFSVTFISLFIITKLFPTLLVVLTPYGTYWLFASFSLAANVLYYFFLPETKGKTLLEIQNSFKQK